MAEHLNIENEQSHFLEDAKFFKDVYIYGKLYYDGSVGVAGAVDSSNINISGIATINNLFVTGVSTFLGSVSIASTISVASTATFGGNVAISSILTAGSLVVDNIDVGIATVRERFELTNDDGTQHVVGFASGPRAGRVGIGSTLPERQLDVVGDIKITENIYDSANSEGLTGYYLSRDAGGIRWVAAAPDAQTDGFFAQNEGVLVGVGSFSTINFIGNQVGGDLVNATVNSVNSTTLDVTIKDHWIKNNSGIHTTVHVGINVENPIAPLDVNGIAWLRSELRVSGVSTFADTVRIDAPLRVHDNDIVGTALTAKFAHLAGVSTFARQTGFATVAGIATFTPLAGVATYARNAGVATFANIVGIATFARQAGFATVAGIATRSNVAFAATFAKQAGFATVSGIATFALTAGIVTFARNAGFATVSGISTFSNQAGFSTAAGISTFAKQSGFSTSAGIATFANQAGFATVAGFATNAARAGIATFIQTVQTLTNQDFFIPFVENATSQTSETVRVDSGIKYNPATDTVTVGGGLTVGSAATVHGALKVDGNSVFDGSVELNSTLIDINGDTGVSAAKTDYRLASVGSGVSWRPAGVETKNILYVTKDGNDNNSGLLEGDAKATIGGAAAVALDGDTIYVRPGTYFENNPIGLRTDVSISGQDLRLVTVVPNNPNEDLFHVRRGCLIENMNFAGSRVGVSYTGAMVAFPPLTANQNSGYVAPGPVNEGPSGRYRSPYIRNCTNFATNSIGLKVDGDLVDAAFTGTNNLGQDLKSMVVDSYTQYNENGIGVSITNKGYAQLVSIFTINSKIAIFAGSGGQCDLTNSNSSFGNFGLYADGTSEDEFTGINTGAKNADVDTFQVFGVRDEDAAVRKPFDGQGAFFKINLDDYNDTGTKTGIVTEPLRTIRSIKVTNGGSGYSQTSPPAVTVSEPFGPEGILAELSANVSAAGTISSIDIVASGRNFLPAGSGSNQQDITITFSGSGGATAEAVTDPIFFTVNTATTPTTNTGISTVTFNEFVPYSVGTGVSVSFRRLSRIITSSHSFEYVGAGTDINRANPFQGGEPIPANEVVAINGGQVPFTSTDQKGNFRIGAGLVIDQTTATISGRDFNRAIQANLTPLILALGG